MVWELVSGFLFGAVGGITYGIAGYIKARQTDNAEFNLDDFLVTTVSSGIAGGIVTYSGQPLNIFTTSTEGLFLSVIVKKVYDAIKEKLNKK